LILVVLWHELRSSHLLGRCSAACTMPPAFSALVILDSGTCFLPKPIHTIILLFWAPHHHWHDRCTLLCSAIRWDGVLLTFFMGCSGTVILLISASHVARITSVSHWHLTI
jgi:hypothetical protein